MNKKWIVAAIILAIIAAIVTYINYEKIEEYISNKSWQLADSVATIYTDNINQVETGKNLVVLTKNSIDLYNNSDKSNYSIPIVSSEILTDTSDEYTIIAEKTTGFVTLMNNTEKVWEKNFSGTVTDVVVNKNGYAAITYYQTGYKSVIKVLKNNGEELFTNFLAASYAIDVDIANNNKVLAVAEIDTEGIKVVSKIEIVEIDSANKTKINKLYECDDEVILDVEYTKNGELFVLKDSAILKIDQEKVISNILEYDYSTVAYATVENGENAIVVRKKSSGIFGSESVLEIINGENKKDYELYSTPQGIFVQGKTVALNMGNEAIFTNTNGKLIKRYNLGGQLKEIILYDNGNMAALVFKNKIELIKI